MRGEEKRRVRLANLRLLNETRSLADIARRSNVDAVYLSQILNEVVGKGRKSPRSLTDNYAAKIEAGLGLEPGWLDQRHDAALPAAEEPTPAADLYPRTPSEDDYALVPQYTAKGACGNGHINSHVEVKGGLAFKRDWLASLGVKPENALVIYASGDSMAPTIQDGAVVLLDRSQTEVRNGKTYAFLAEDEVRIKRVFRSLAGVWTLASDNPNKAQHPDEEIEDPSTLSVIGRCVWQGGAL